MKFIILWSDMQIITYLLLRFITLQPLTINNCSYINRIRSNAAAGNKLTQSRLLNCLLKI